MATSFFMLRNRFYEGFVQQATATCRQFVARLQVLKMHQTDTLSYPFNVMLV